MHVVQPLPIPLKYDFEGKRLVDLLDGGHLLLHHVRDYLDSNMLVLVFKFVFPPLPSGIYFDKETLYRKHVGIIHLSVQELKKSNGEIHHHVLTEQLGHFSYSAVFMREHPNGVVSGYLSQTPSAIKLFLKYFMNFKDEILPIPEDPVQFAEDCFVIHKYTQHLIHARYIDRFMEDHLLSLDEKTNLSAESIISLKEKFDVAIISRGKNGKNGRLIKFLREKCEEVDAFHCEWTEKFCSANMQRIHDEVSRILGLAGDKISFPRTAKSSYRIQQKYEEYCQHYLTPGLHAYKKFKDLFRGSIAWEDFVTVDVSKLPLSSINIRDSGNYRACYVILNIFSMNFELKIVKDVSAAVESHLWYELKRNSSLQNLAEFLRRQIKEEDAK
mgnify:FL=1